MARGRKPAEKKMAEKPKDPFAVEQEEVGKRSGDVRREREREKAQSNGAADENAHGNRKRVFRSQQLLDADTGTNCFY